LLLVVGAFTVGLRSVLGFNRQRAHLIERGTDLLQITVLGLSKRNGIADVGVCSVALADLRNEADRFRRAGGIIRRIHDFRTRGQAGQRRVQHAGGLVQVIGAIQRRDVCIDYHN